jgi:hypothetical protein
MNNVFDDLAREVGRGISRRDALRRFGSGLAGMLLASLGLKKASAAVDCGTCQACDLDTNECGLPCNPSSAGNSLCTKAGQDGSYLRLVYYLTSNGFVSVGLSQPVIFYKNGGLSQSILGTTFQNSAVSGQTAFIGYAVTAAGDISTFAVVLTNGNPVYELTIDPDGRVLQSVATQTVGSGANTTHEESRRSVQSVAVASAAGSLTRGLASPALTQSQCDTLVDELCKFANDHFWSPLCYFLILEVCFDLTGPLAPLCWLAVKPNVICNDLTSAACMAAESQLCPPPTCPFNQQACNGVCCNYCQNCNPDTGMCVENLNCAPLACCSGSQNGVCCESGYTCVNGVCTSPNPGCLGATCTTFVPCSSANPDCVCGTVTTGGGLCVPGSTPCDSLVPCSSTGSCPSGSLCVIGSCCGDPVCVPTSLSSKCPAAATANGRLMLRIARGSGPTIGHR